MAAASVIANSGVLDEISNVPDAISRYLRSQGRVPAQGTQTTLTTLPVLFALYQTGMHGPQNGFRLVLVRESCDPSTVETLLMQHGHIDRQAKEMLVVDDGGVTVVE